MTRKGRKRSLRVGALAGGGRATLYFAYGSNLDAAQMAERCPGARLAERAWLDDHRLAFTGASRLWGGGVATVVPATGWQVLGVLYVVGPRELQALDAFEGHPWFYRRTKHMVRCVGDNPEMAVLYTLDSGEHGLAPPSEPYVEVIARGYEQHGFAPDALAMAIALATEGRYEA